MKKQLLAACAAALMLGAVGCDEPKPARDTRSSTHAKLEPPPAIASRRPGGEPPRTHAASSVTIPTGLDAGVAMEVSQVAEVEEDVLSLPHEDGRTIDHLARARTMREQGDLQGALAEARRALFDTPDDEETLAAIDRLSKLTGDRKLRVATLKRLGELRTDDATPLIQQARVMISMKDYAGAVEVAKSALERDGANPEGYQALGRAHLNLGQLSSAIAQFQKVIELAPDHGYALNNLGFAYLRANRNEEAVEVLTRAAEVLPMIAYVHNNLGVALERVGRTEEAKAAYAQSSFLSPKYVKARINAARVAQVTAGLEEQSDSSVDVAAELAGAVEEAAVEEAEDTVPHPAE